MEEFLRTLSGKKIDIFCGGAASLGGVVVKVENGVLHLQDDESKLCYVAIEKIIAVWEKRDKEHLAGFMSKS